MVFYKCWLIILILLIPIVMIFIFQIYNRLKVVISNRYINSVRKKILIER